MVVLSIHNQMGRSMHKFCFFEFLFLLFGHIRPKLDGANLVESMEEWILFFLPGRDGCIFAC